MLVRIDPCHVFRKQPNNDQQPTMGLEAATTRSDAAVRVESWIP